MEQSLEVVTTPTASPPRLLDLQALVYLARSSEGVFERCTRLALESTSATTSFVLLHRPGLGTLEVVSGAGHLGAEAVGRQLRPGDALAWRVFGTRTTQLIGNAEDQQDVYFVSGRAHPGAYLGVPLMDPDGRTFGVLSVDTTHTGAAFTEADAQILALLASAAGIAYSRLAALEQAQALTERYALLAELAAELESLSDAGEIRQAAQRAILPLSGFDTVAFYRLSGPLLTFVERTGRVESGVIEALDLYMENPEAYVLLSKNMDRQVPFVVMDYATWAQRDEGLVEAGVASVVILPVWYAGVAHGFWLLYSLNRQVPVDEVTLRLLGSLSSRVERAIERGEALNLLLQTREAALRGLGRVLEYRDSETAGHTDRVTRLAVQLGQRLGLDREQQRHLRWGAYLHDVGKMGIRDEILRKPGHLTPEERLQIETHVTVGDELLNGEGFLPAEVREIVRHHHERWDGHGYPDRLAGRAIPLLARVFSVVDVFDALTSQRPYKVAWTSEAAARQLREGAGSQFDPEILEVFLEQVLKEEW
ncbi:HD domain-containing phosphohydrolase [Deinococcus sp. UYEF24]